MNDPMTTPDPAAVESLAEVLADVVERATERAYFQIAIEKCLTIQRVGVPGDGDARAAVPGHWRAEAEARASVPVADLLALLAARTPMAPEADREHEATGWAVHAEHIERTNREALHQASVIDELKGLLRRACEADANEDCWFDHNGGCQAHGFLGEPCPYPFIRQYLADTPVALSPDVTPEQVEREVGERIARAIEATHSSDWSWPADREFAARLVRKEATR